ncbi:MAG: helix-turn-helix transcriptional regulator [Phycisphaerae bacterium]
MTDSTKPENAYTSAEQFGAAQEPRGPTDRRRAVDDERLALSATALANRLGISRAHVWKLLSLGRLPAPVRLGRAVRWDKRIVDAWLAAGAPPLSQWERMKQTEKVR